MQVLIWCSDAQLLDYDDKRAADKILDGTSVAIQPLAIVRDHVRLELDTDCFKDGGKFDEEIVPPGARFALELKLDGWNKELSSRQEQLFLSLCSALKQDIRIGGKRSNGYGRVHAIYAQCRRYTMTDPEDVVAWLNLPNTPQFPEHSGTEINIDQAVPLKHYKPDTFSCELMIPLKSMGPLLVGGNNDQDDADLTFLLTPILSHTEQEYSLQYTIPGSAIRGALRHRVYKIAEVLGLDADSLVDGIFGAISTSTQGQASRGKLILEDIYLDSNVKPTTVQHVAIDRFTGGAVRGALFDEAPVWNTSQILKMHLQADNLRREEARVLLHALLDLVTGSLPLGGGVNRGNGRVCLQHLEQGLSSALRAIRGHCSYNGELLNPEDSAMLEKWLTVLEG